MPHERHTTFLNTCPDRAGGGTTPASCEDRVRGGDAFWVGLRTTRAGVVVRWGGGSSPARRVRSSVPAVLCSSRKVARYPRAKGPFSSGDKWRVELKHVGLLLCTLFWGDRALVVEWLQGALGFESLPHLFGATRPIRRARSTRLSLLSLCQFEGSILYDGLAAREVLDLFSVKSLHARLGPHRPRALDVARATLSALSQTRCTIASTSEPTSSGMKLSAPAHQNGKSGYGF